MRNQFECNSTILMLMLSLFLMGADNGEQGGDERGALRDRQKALQARIETLQAEQEFLLFQKEMYTSDSKYLVLHLMEKTGQLKYKNRILKDFRFMLSKATSPGKLRMGMLTLTNKREGKNSRHELVFGNDLIIRRKNAVVPPHESGIVSLLLTKKDMQSVFFAIEPGARIYIAR